MSTLKITQDLAISITSSLPVGVCVVGYDGIIVYANPKAENIFNFNKNEFNGHSVEDLIPEKYRHSHQLYRKDYGDKPTSIAMSGGRVLTGIQKNGDEISLQIGLTPLPDNYILVSFIESTNKIIRPSSSYDPLTGLLNRKLFDEYGEKLRKLAIRNKKSLAIVFIDLDNFKAVNDQFGHKIGDMVICEVANVISTNVRESDIVARVGGDEFVIFFYDTEKYIYLKKLLAKLLYEISSLSRIDNYTINIGASMGAMITGSPENVNINDLVHMADKLMYKAKKSGKGVVMINEIDTLNLTKNT
jgi:diguanylate cyclase (GGDEF)-like protein/PAS domain S-box-containing protein